MEDRRNCRNLDECQLGTALCQHSELCQDTLGSYACRCPRGYNLAPDRHACLDVDECELGYSYYCTHGCRNLPGGYECTCPEGYALRYLRLCEDVDECAVASAADGGGGGGGGGGGSRCDVSSGARCQNVVGSYVCLCPFGLRVDSTGLRCIGEDERVCLFVCVCFVVVVVMVVEVRFIYKVVVYVASVVRCG